MREAKFRGLGNYRGTKNTGEKGRLRQPTEGSASAQARKHLSGRVYDRCHSTSPQPCTTAAPTVQTSFVEVYANATAREGFAGEGFRHYILQSSVVRLQIRQRIVRRIDPLNFSTP